MAVAVRLAGALGAENSSLQVILTGPAGRRAGVVPADLVPGKALAVIRDHQRAADDHAGLTRRLGRDQWTGDSAVDSPTGAGAHIQGRLRANIVAHEQRRAARQSQIRVVVINDPYPVALGEAFGAICPAL